MTSHKSNELTPVQIKLIELIVSENKTVKDATEEVGIGRTTYYDYLKLDKFKRAMDEAIELKVQEAKKNIKVNVNKYIRTLDNLSEKGKNEAARVNAIGKLFTLAELDPQFKSEVTIKNDDSAAKNAMLEKLKQKKQEEE